MEEIRSMKDIEAFVEKHGGVESFVTELAARGVAPASQLRAFKDDVQAKAVARPNDLLAKTTLMELVYKHGLSERMMDWASSFMRLSERAVRRRSWMAHYLRAREVLDVNGVTVEADHPWLVEMARRGTEASQFLYNPAARPMSASDECGKGVRAVPALGVELGQVQKRNLRPCPDRWLYSRYAGVRPLQAAGAGGPVRDGPGRTSPNIAIWRVPSCSLELYAGLSELLLRG
jgi:hypothetical protein